jgi:hypothetical protein
MNIEMIFSSLSVSTEIFLVSKYYYEIYTINENTQTNKYSIKEPNFINYNCFGENFVTCKIK